METLNDEVKIMDAIARYLYNKTPKEIVHEVLGEDLHEDYEDKWVERLSNGFPSFYGHLDYANKAQFLKAVKDYIKDQGRASQMEMMYINQELMKLEEQE